MKVVVTQKNNIGGITVTKKNNIGRVTFSKIAKVGSISISQIRDVETEGQEDGDVLVFNEATSSYQIKKLPKIDGGAF